MRFWHDSRTNCSVNSVARNAGRRLALAQCVPAVSLFVRQVQGRLLQISICQAKPALTNSRLLERTPSQLG